MDRRSYFHTSIKQWKAFALLGTFFRKFKACVSLRGKDVVCYKQCLEPSRMARSDPRPPTQTMTLARHIAGYLLEACCPCGHILVVWSTTSITESIKYTPSVPKL